MSTTPLPHPNSHSNDANENKKAFTYSSNTYRELGWHDQAAAVQNYEQMTNSLSPKTQEGLRRTTVELADRARELKKQDEKTAVKKWVSEHPAVWEKNGVCEAPMGEFAKIVVNGIPALPLNAVTTKLMTDMTKCLAKSSRDSKEPRVP